MNGGPAQALTPAFSYSIACKDQAEIGRYETSCLRVASPLPAAG